MSLTLPAKGTDFTPTPAGNHFATCYRIIDLGTQLTEFNGQQKQQHKIMIGWELPDLSMEDGSPFSMHQRYTFSSSQKATLRKHLESWRGRPFSDADFGTFDLGKLLGVNCLLNIVHEEKNGKTYANIASIGSLPKAMNMPMTRVTTNKTVNFDLGAFDKNVYDGLSDGLKAVIAKSPEYQQIMGAHKIEQSTADERGVSQEIGDLDSQEIPF